MMRQQNQGHKLNARKQQQSHQHNQTDQMGSYEVEIVEGYKTCTLLHRTIVALKFQHEGCNQKYYGSGVLLSRDTVLTAAHNIYDKEYSSNCAAFAKEFTNMGITQPNRQFCKASFRVFLGRNGKADGGYEVEDWRYPAKFKKASPSQQNQFDYALIKLKANRTIAQNKFLSLSLPCNYLLSKDQDVQLKIYGYPSSYNYNYTKSGTTTKLYQYGLTQSNSILKVRPKQFLITHTIRTLPGQTGCPIVVDNQIIAIHTLTYGTGRLVTKDLISNVSKWDDQLHIIQPKKQQASKAFYGFWMALFDSDKQSKEQGISEVKKQQNVKIQELSFIDTLRAALRFMFYFFLLLLGYVMLAYCTESLCSSYKHPLPFARYSLLKQLLSHSNRTDRLKDFKIYQRRLALRAQIQPIKDGSYQLSFSVMSPIDKEIAKAQHFKDIADQHKKKKNYQLALEYYQKIIFIYEDYRGEDSLVIAQILVYDIGDIYERNWNLSAALKAYERGLGIFEIQEEQSNHTAATLGLIGHLYYRQGDYSEALDNFWKALTIWHKIKGRDSTEASQIINKIGMANGAIKQSNMEIANLIGQLFEAAIQP